ncbi:MAG: penicillin-binding protein 2 [Burkholderiales bacterium]|jgi:cell division protein FtsI (penicillin-binding protein 3)|nr:penicillin-binding protein 2 [Burkholderiales bacterium]
MNPAANPALRLMLPAWRSRLMLLMLLAAFAVLLGRAVYLQGLNNDFLRERGEARYGRVLEITAHRGIITDRHGEPLAVSTPVESVWASPDAVRVTPDQERQLAKLVGLTVTELRKRLEEKSRDFVYLRRQMPPDEAAKVMNLHLPGIFLQREYRRYYPAGEVASHLVGFTSVDETGQEGLELALQNWLAGKPGSRRVIKDRRGHIVEDVEGIRAPEEGRDLRLSIDSKIQFLAYRELKNAVLSNKARAGGIVVLDAKNGEVLALANYPSYNPNSRETRDPARYRDRAVTDLFEPGSTLKPFTAAAALAAGLYTPETLIQTAPGRLEVGRKTIRDVHPHGTLTVAQVIQKSSNVGAAKMALALPKEKLWTLLSGVGFGTVPQSGLPGEVAGRLRNHSTWRPIEQATMSYGHGISVSLLQLARAYSIFTSDGELIPVTVLRTDAPPTPTRVVKPAVALAVRRMLEMATQSGGTAPKAQVTGYRVAGKTGTAHKLENGGYAPDKYVSSFVGFAPVSDPRLIVAVMIDDPRNGPYYGGLVAAPVFSSVMAGSLRLLAVPPDAPEALGSPLDAPEIREEV